MGICLGAKMDKRGDKEDKIKKYIAESLKNKKYDIYNSSGKPSPSKLAAQIKKETGITVTRQTIATYLKDDLSSYTSKVDYSQNTTIQEIRAAMDIAKDIYENSDSKPADKTKAMNAWRQLNQQRIDHEQSLRELDIRKIEAGRPNWLIRIRATVAVYKCSKCGYETHIEDDGKGGWVEVGQQEKKDEKYFKSGNGQSTIEGVEDEE